MAVALSVNTKPEFVFIAAISVVSTLLGPKTKLEIREQYQEPCNLYSVCLSDPGAGKSQAFQIAVQRPLRHLREPARSMVVHDFTGRPSVGTSLFVEGRALVTHAEMSSFYELILKKQQDGLGERQIFSEQYDGTAEWALTTATTNSGTSTSKASDAEKKKKTRSINGECIGARWVYAARTILATV